MESTPPPAVSIVVPLYNEEDNIAPLCTAIREALEGWDRTFEVLLVDDGSADGTARLVAEQARRDPRFQLLRLTRNSGQTQAMATGFARSRGEIIVSMDGDLQNDPRDIPLLVSRIDHGFDVVCGWRKDRKDTFLSRKVPSKIANKMIAWITGIPIHDNGCSLKAYRASIIRSIRLYSEMHRFLPALSSMAGAKIDEVVVRHHPRIHGQTKYGISRTFKVLGDMVIIKMLTQFPSRPGRWFALLSLPFLFLSVLTSAIWLNDIRLGVARPSIVFSSLSVMFMYLFGNMIAWSVLGELLLARADRKYLRRLATILALTETRGPSAGRDTS